MIFSPATITRKRLPQIRGDVLLRLPRHHNAEKRTFKLIRIPETLPAAGYPVTAVSMVRLLGHSTLLTDIYTSVARYMSRAI